MAVESEGFINHPISKAHPRSNSFAMLPLVSCIPFWFFTKYPNVFFSWLHTQIRALVLKELSQFKEKWKHTQLKIVWNVQEFVNNRVHILQLDVQAYKKSQESQNGKVDNRLLLIRNRSMWSTNCKSRIHIDLEYFGLSRVKMVFHNFRF